MAHSGKWLTACPAESEQPGTQINLSNTQEKQPGGFLKMENVKINTEFITLQQLLKTTDVIQSGGMVKWYLAEHEVLVNGEHETRRGKKLYAGDVVSIPEVGEFKVTTE